MGRWPLRFEIRFALLLSVAGIVLTACGDLRGQSLRLPPQTKFDEIGYEYRDVFVDGLWQRAYREPMRQVVAWEVCRRLPGVGLPGLTDNRPACGHDALGRHWRRDELGYAYFDDSDCYGVARRHYYQPERRSLAAHVRTQLDCVDWQGAVRSGVNHAAVRGFNAAGGPAAADAAMVRSVVRERVVEGLNLAGIGYGARDLPRFQDLVTAGVEDAVVEAFNRLDVIGDPALEFVPPAPSGLEPIPAVPPQSDRSAAEEEGAERLALSAVQLPANQRVRQIPDTAGALETGATTPGNRFVGSHYGGPLRGGAFSERYDDVRFADSGWCVDASGMRPLTGKGFLILMLKGDSQRDHARPVEVWQNRVLIYEDCYYAEFYEDARRLVSRGS